MPTVTGLTAAKMREIEDASIVDGNVVAGNLILIKHDGSQVNAGSVEGSQGPAGGYIFSSPLSDGPPSNPVDGQVWIATHVDTNGVCWMFRYNADSSSPYKWEFIGGSPKRDEITSQAGTTNWQTGEYLDGPTVSIARAGDYRFDFGAEISTNLATYGALMFVINATRGVHPHCIFNQYFVQSEWETMMNAGVFLAIPAGESIRAYYQVYGSGGGGAYFQSRFIRVTPIRIA
jgi:hypothetical protein